MASIFRSLVTMETSFYMVSTPVKIRILYVIPTVGTGGTENVVASLQERLDPSRFQVSVCAFDDGPLRKRFTDRGKKLHSLFELHYDTARLVPKIKKNMLRLKKLRNIIRQEQADIVHTHHLGPLVNVYLATRGMTSEPALVHTEHVRPDLDNNPARIMMVMPFIFRRVTVVTGVTSWISQYFIDTMGMARAKVKTIPNGIDLQRFGFAHDPMACRRKLGLGVKDIVICVVGNLRRQKNHVCLIRAMPDVLRAYPSCRLLIVGEGEEERAIRSLTDSLNLKDHVVLLGPRHDIPEILSAADIYCLPSFYEGMPLTLLEAMTAGKPVVATDVPGNCDVVKHEHNGLLVPSDQPEAIAAAVLRILDNPVWAKTLAEAGHRMVFENFSIDKMISSYTDLYEDVYKDSPRSSRISS